MKQTGTALDAERKARLAGFVAYVRAHLKGDEKGEAQIFLDRLFQGFGHGGVREAGATCEERIRKGKSGGTSFLDLLWPPKVLIEMKRRGEDLTKHYQQAFDYWTKTIPRPAYVVLCNFDDFWVYDFDAQLYDPMDKVKLDDLPVRYGPLSFLFTVSEAPVFGDDHESVTREAADDLAACFNSFVERGIDRSLAQRFVLQALVALFSEDIGLLPKYFLTKLLEECVDPPTSFDLLGGLFKAMNTPGGVGGGRYKGVDYFNGGLFSQSAAIELTPAEVQRLRKASNDDWSKVRPEIFGTLFQHSLGKAQRHAYGAHFTSHIDIMKIVHPTIIAPWTEAIESARTLKELGRLRTQLRSLRVLDPACGSGNFLFIAYREMRKLEARIEERENDLSKAAAKGQKTLGMISTKQFLGIDVDAFAVELAKVTLVIARKLAIDELHSTEPSLPLDNLDANFLVSDALVSHPPGSIGPVRTPWPDADVIIGNPPFLGSKDLKPERGPVYADELRMLYPEIPGMADYCVHWIRRAHDHLPASTKANPFVGRAGLVGTQNIRNNKSREAGLDHVVVSGVIVEAVDNQPWSGEANVHVSIANWVKLPGSATRESELLIPARRRLWYRMDPQTARGKQGRAKSKTTVVGSRGRIRRDKSFSLTFRECDYINSALSDQADLSQAKPLRTNAEPQRVFQGVTPGHDGFLLSPEEAKRLIAQEPASSEILHPYLIGREIVTGNGRPSRFILDFGQRTQLEAAGFPRAFDRVERIVLPARLKSAEEGKDAQGNVRPHHKSFLERWWQLSWGRAEMLASVGKLGGRFMACSRVTKRPIFVFISTDIRPGDALQTFAFDDDYSFGVLSASVHWSWFVAKGSKHSARPRYTSESVFDQFAWPQAPTINNISAVAQAGRQVRHVRNQVLPATKGGLRALYRTLDLPGSNLLRDAHAALDAAVLSAYGFSAKKDLLQQLLGLNLEVARRETRGKPTTSPGIPAGYRSPKSLITTDCITANL